jgi:hypothetical protein
VNCSSNAQAPLALCRGQGTCKTIMIAGNINRRVCASTRCHSSQSGLLSAGRIVPFLGSSNSVHGMLSHPNDTNITMVLLRDGYAGRSAVASHEQRTTLSSRCGTGPTRPRCRSVACQLVQNQNTEYYFHGLSDGSL